MERRRRSLLKAITWRIIAIIVLLVLSYYFTGDWGATGLITTSFNAIQVLLYYFHERIWSKVNWGHKKRFR